MSDALFGLDDKVVLVTGGSRGLGRALSLGLTARGATVVVASRKLDACETVVAEIEAAGGQASATAVHVGDWSSLDAVVPGVVERWGRIDALVNNAGMGPTAPSLAEVSEALFDKILAVNLKGPTRLTALAATAMAVTGGGSIVNISSQAALRPTPIAPVYSAAKAGLNAMTVASAIEFRARVGRWLRPGRG
jgi:NAD(P)-dependent dehydrogenase (short-subunit alcohol dehydrogenase family)